MDRSQCAVCRHWQTTDRDRAAGRASTGECRRHAPQPSNGAGAATTTQWPRTRASDWCGEFSPSEDRPGREPSMPGHEATLIEREPVRRGRQGQLACRGLVCITDEGSKLVIWGRDSNMENLHAVNRARLPVRVAFEPTRPERWSQERYGDTHWVEPEAALDIQEELVSSGP